MKFYVTVCLLLIITVTNAARILGVYPFPAYSHFQLGDRIFKELARRDHDVTVISPFEEKTPLKNFKQVIVNNVLEKAAEIKLSLFDYMEYNIVERVMWMDTFGISFTQMALNSSNVRNFLQEENSFDLVIIHHFMNDALNGFCYRFKAPCIAITSVGAPNWFNDKVGLSAPPSFVPQLLLSYSGEMSFFQRLHNTVVYILVQLSHHFYRYPNQNRLLQEYFPGAPHLDDLYYNVSLILFNGHISISDVSPMLPNTIDIAGYHMNPPTKLPNDLQQHLDNATDGVIYFSMGSTIKSKDFPAAAKKAILNVFSKLKQKVFWKYEEDLPNKPENVLIRSWFPQQDILAHPNVLLFISHGGLLGTIESVYYGKPILGLPVYADQGLNVAKVQNDGYGRLIPFMELTESNFFTELKEVLHNPMYSTNAKRRSKILHDQPINPLDKAIFWIEYVLRHKGAPHLKSSALQLTWYQYFLVDVIFAFLIYFIFITFLIKFTYKKLCNLYNTRNHTNKVKQK